MEKSPYIAPAISSRYRTEAIIKEECSRYGYTKEQVLSRNRQRLLSECRQVIMYRLRKELRLPFQHIGAIIQRHHSNVIYAIRQVEILKETGQLLIN